MAVVYIGIGSNLGDRQAHIDKTLGVLREGGDIEILAVSSFIETEAEGGPEGQSPYLNGAVKIRTSLTPLELLSRLKKIERRCGRAKTEERNLPRQMDLDILFYDDVVIVDGKTLSIPHPRMERRRFVLAPLAEIAPDAFHPRLRKTVRELLDALSTHEAVPNGASA